MRAGKSLVLLGLFQAVVGAPSPAPSEDPSPSSSTLPVPSDVPSDPAVALDQLESLATATAEMLQDEMEAQNGTSTVQRRTQFGPGCTLSKLQIRREWFVSPLRFYRIRPSADTAQGAR